MTRYVSCRAIDVSHSRILKRIKRTILKRVVWSSSRQHYTEERNKQTFWILSLSRERKNSKSHHTRTSKTVNRSFSLAFFRHKFNTFVPNASASDASFAFDICSLLFYGDDDERRVISLSRKSECLKFQILSSSRRDEFSTRSLSLFFLSADREVYVYKTPLLKRRERREKESAGCYFQLSLSSVCFCAWCVYSIAQREE